MICLEFNSTSLSKGNTNPFINTKSTKRRQRELTLSAGTVLSQKEKFLSTRLGSMCSTVPALFPKTSIHLNHGTYFSSNRKWPHVIDSKDLPILFYIETLFQVSLLNSSSSRNAQSTLFPSKAQEWHKTSIFTLSIWICLVVFPVSKKYHIQR